MPLYALLMIGLNTYVVEVPETFTCSIIADVHGEKRGVNTSTRKYDLETSCRQPL